MVTSRSPCLTSAPSRKCTLCTAPATRERTSTRSTASSRPENSSQALTCVSVTVATDTGVACGCCCAGGLLASALKLCMPKTPAATASTAVTPVTVGHTLRRASDGPAGFAGVDCAPAPSERSGVLLLVGFDMVRPCGYFGDATTLRARVAPVGNG